VSLVFGRDEEVARWAANKLRIRKLGELTTGFVRPFTTIGVRDRSGQYSGAFIFSRFTGPDVELTVVGAGAITRSAFQAAARYVFDDLGCVRVSATIRADNDRALAVARKFGFKQEGIRRKGFKDHDAVLLGLLREDYRYG
jgi:hypothetical protein